MDIAQPTRSDTLVSSRVLCMSNVYTPPVVLTTHVHSMLFEDFGIYCSSKLVLLLLLLEYSGIPNCRVDATLLTDMSVLVISPPGFSPIPESQRIGEHDCCRIRCPRLARTLGLHTGEAWNTFVRAGVFLVRSTRCMDRMFSDPCGSQPRLGIESCIQGNEGCIQGDDIVADTLDQLLHPSSHGQ